MKLTRFALLLGTLLVAACQADGQQANSLSLPPQNALFVASSAGSVYYPISCDVWHDLSRANLRWFETHTEAEAAGYRATTAGACRSALPPADEPLTDTCTVTRIVDGDTLDCREGNERIRLLLVDTPELEQGEYGGLARDALEGLLPVGAAARVELDLVQRDRYGRLLAYLYTAEGRLVNEELARLGFAVVSIYQPNVQHVDRIRAAAEEAQLSRRGLWSGSAFECLPADHRARRC